MHEGRHFQIGKGCLPILKKMTAELWLVFIMQNNVDVLTLPEFTSINSALESIEAEGLQAPCLQELQNIVDAAVQATGLFALAAVLPLQDSDIREFFSDFVIRCVNRGPGVGDAAAY